MDLHKGKVWVTSAGEGKGTTFTLELPVFYDGPIDIATEEYERNLSSDAIESNPDENQERRSSGVRVSHNHTNTFLISSSNSLHLHELNALVVDDAPLNRKMTMRLISGSFATVGEAVDGYDAVQKVRESIQLPGQSFDVILMDNIMPNMDGPTASKELRALGYKGLIIGVTGSALPVDINHFINHGANHVLIKPLDLNQLMSILEDNNISKIVSKDQEFEFI